MFQILLLCWFPLLVVVAFGARMSHRRHGVALGTLCGTLWIAIVQITAETWWRYPSLLVPTLSGAAAIVLIGYLGSAQTPSPESLVRGQDLSLEIQDSSLSADGLFRFGFAPQSMISAFQQFDAWLEIHRYDDDPWADFDELVRSVLFQWTGATHVKTYRVLSEGDELIPLRELDACGRPDIVSARRGIEGYVATTGRSFVAGDTTHGVLVDQLKVQSPKSKVQNSKSKAQRSESSRESENIGPIWCFAVVRGIRKIGVVAVERFERSERGEQRSLGATGTCPWSPMQFRLVELVISQFWNTLTEVCRSRTAVMTDPGSSGLTRKTFFEIGRELLADAYRRGEPVAVAVIGMEWLRKLDDDGAWEAADDIRATVSRELKQRLRSEDRLGRFDDSRFVILLRRVDSELAMLIMKELTNRLSRVLDSRKLRDRRIELRCGLAGSGVTGNAPVSAKPSLEKLISTAIDLCQQARQASVMISSDLQSADEPVRAAGPTDS